MMFPELYHLARFKKISVREAIHNGRWMQGLQRMTTEVQLNQFVRLWEEIQSIQLTDRKDKILWTLTANRRYSAASAYDVHFVARITKPGLAHVWRGKMEGKVKFYLWLLLQNRNWTADRLQARGLPHNDLCCLCDQEKETAEHITLTCCFAKEV